MADQAGAHFVAPAAVQPLAAEQIQQVLQAVQAAGIGAAPAAPLIKPIAPSSFSGNMREDVDQWVYQANIWLTAGRVASEMEKMVLITGLFRGAALTWWRTRSAQADAPATWLLLAAELVTQFQPINAVESARDRLANCRQVGSVAAYAAAFRSTVLSIPDMADGDKKHRFIAGLKPRTQQEVKLRDPPSFDEAVKAAVRFDSILRPASSKWQQDKYSSGDAVPMELGTVAAVNHVQPGRRSGHPNGQRGLSRGPKLNPTQHQHAKLGQRLYIPPAADSLRRQLLEEYHDTRLAGHLGMDKTLGCLERNYWWPTLRADVREYVGTCPCCQANKGTNTKPIGVLHPLPIPTRKWEMVTTDLITQLPRAPSGKDAIAVFVDKLTKMVHLAATTTTVTAPEFARLYFDNVVRLHGVQRSIVSDRDPRFTSKFWEALHTLQGTSLSRSTAYHPQTDGQTERANRTLEEMLRAYVDTETRNWDDHLAAAEFAINNAPHASSGQSPFYLNFGQHPLLPATMDLAVLGQKQNQAGIDFASQTEADLQRAKSYCSKLSSGSNTTLISSVSSIPFQ
ncbi:hypothetical protein N2152v2_007826 [Parachlorella kessleri]